MKRILIVAAALCAAPFAANAAIAPPAAKAITASASEKVRVADYYKGKKHCYTRGSATICN